MWQTPPTMSETPLAPFDVRLDLSGWTLVWAELTVDPASPAAYAVLRETIGKARARYGAQLSADDPTVAAIRKLFRAAGCDPTRYRPSSEALLRRVLKGEELAAIQPLVDLNNALSIDLAVPSCIMAADSMKPPLVLRAGAPGETFESLRGPFSLEGKPLLADAQGPLGTPITDQDSVEYRPRLAGRLPAGGSGVSGRGGRDVTRSRGAGGSGGRSGVRGLSQVGRVTRASRPSQTSDDERAESIRAARDSKSGS